MTVTPLPVLSSNVWKPPKLIGSKWFRMENGISTVRSMERRRCVHLSACSNQTRNGNALWSRWRVWEFNLRTEQGGAVRSTFDREVLQYLLGVSRRQIVSVQLENGERSLARLKWHVGQLSVLVAEFLASIVASFTGWHPRTTIAAVLWWHGVSRHAPQVRRTRLSFPAR